MCFLFILGTNRARGEGGSEGTPKDATPEGEGPASQQCGRKAHPGACGSHLCL